MELHMSIISPAPSHDSNCGVSYRPLLVQERSNVHNGNGKFYPKKTTGCGV